MNSILLDRESLFLGGKKSEKLRSSTIQKIISIKRKTKWFPLFARLKGKKEPSSAPFLSLQIKRKKGGGGGGTNISEILLCAAVKGTRPKLLSLMDATRKEAQVQIRAVY